MKDKEDRRMTGDEIELDEDDVEQKVREQEERVRKESYS